MIYNNAALAAGLGGVWGPGTQLGVEMSGNPQGLASNGILANHSQVKKTNVSRKSKRKAAGNGR